MALTIKEVKRESCPATRLIGKKYEQSPNWGEWWENDWFSVLEKNQPLPINGDAYIGAVHIVNGMPEFWIGMFFPVDTEVPDGFDFVDIEALDYGKVLVQRDRDGNEYALPGGHIKIGETLEAGLIREYKEETGADISCLKMLWSEECFWEWKGRNAHNISFYYLIELKDNSDIPDTGEFVSHKDNCNVVIGWMPIEEIKNVTIYPEFIKEEIYQLDEPIKHFVSEG